MRNQIQGKQRYHNELFQHYGSIYPTASPQMRHKQYYQIQIHCSSRNPGMYPEVKPRSPGHATTTELLLRRNESSVNCSCGIQKWNSGTLQTTLESFASRKLFTTSWGKVLSIATLLWWTHIHKSTGNSSFNQSQQSMHSTQNKNAFNQPQTRHWFCISTVNVCIPWNGYNKCLPDEEEPAVSKLTQMKKPHFRGHIGLTETSVLGSLGFKTRAYIRSPALPRKGIFGLFVPRVPRVTCGNDLKTCTNRRRLCLLGKKITPGWGNSLPCRSASFLSASVHF